MRPYEFFLSIGMSKEEMSVENDFPETLQKLNEQLEKKLLEQFEYNAFESVFRGVQENYIKCLNVDYESV